MDVSGARVRQLDTLRGAAAMLVVAFHVGQIFDGYLAPAPAFHAINAWIDPGRVGVVVFFLISGFVMPGSFAGAGPAAVATFARRRFFRLFPAFWVSLLFALVVSIGHGGFIDGPDITPAMIAANATMLPSLFGQYQVVGVYWTLEVELAFYVLLAAIFWRAPLSGDGAARLAFLTLGLCIAYGVVARPLGWSDKPPLNDRLFQALLHLSIMFAGVAVRRHWDAGGSSAAMRGAPPLLLALAATWSALLVGGAAAQIVAEGFGPGALRTPLTYAAAIAIFFFGLARRETGVIGPLLGDRSYSLYLIHVPVIIALVDVTRAFELEALRSFPIFASVSVALSLALAQAMYVWIEKPAIAMGRRRRIPVAAR
ncbi:MAG: acyltransferase [Hyphomonadaceae bacterium]|nr:acyltransferase [Hyphomonadaceae bacterium]